MDMSSCFILFLHRMREHNGLITEFLPQCVNRLVELMLAVALLDILGGIKQRKLLARLIFRQQIGSRDRQQAHQLVQCPSSSCMDRSMSVRVELVGRSSVICRERL